MPKEKIGSAEKEILRRHFLEVVTRFQNIDDGCQGNFQKKIFYEHDKHFIYVKPAALKFFRENYSLLYKAIMFEWAKFLEKINLGLPMLISKIESSERYRGSLEKFKPTLLKHFDTCFYCNNALPSEKI